MALELSGRGGYGVGLLHHDGRAKRRRFLRDHEDKRSRSNGIAITGLQPAGTSIPGNDGYPVDGLVRTEAPQLSLHGFGYALADGTYANPFYGDHFVPPGVYAFFSDPPKSKTSEPLVKFTATTVP